MEDDDLIELCKTIYRKHREAIDLIIQYGKTSPFQNAVENVLSQEDNYEILSSGSTAVWFMPKSWVDTIPENGLVGSFLKRSVSVCCWFEISKSSIYVHFEICKMDDSEIRLRLVNALKEGGFSLSNKAFDENAIYSRFYGKKHSIKDATNYEEVRDSIEKLLNKAKEEFPKTEAILRRVFAIYSKKIGISNAFLFCYSTHRVEVLSSFPNPGLSDLVFKRSQ
jgi:hypothetical protein